MVKMLLINKVNVHALPPHGGMCLVIDRGDLLIDAATTQIKAIDHETNTLKMNLIYQQITSIDTKIVKSPNGLIRKGMTIFKFADEVFVDDVMTNEIWLKMDEPDHSKFHYLISNMARACNCHF